MDKELFDELLKEKLKERIKDLERLRSGIYEDEDGDFSDRISEKIDLLEKLKWALFDY